MANISGLDTSYLSLLAMLDKSNTDIAETSKRLASGRKVMSAGDNASVFFQAQAYTSRSTELATLNNDGLLATRSIKAAQSGLDTMKQLLQSLQKTMTDARTAPTDALQSRAVSAVGYTGASASLVGSGATRFNEGDVFSVTVGSTTVSFKATASGTGGAGTGSSPFAVGTVQDLITKLGSVDFGGHAVSASLSSGQLVMAADATMTIRLETNGAGSPVNDMAAMFSGGRPAAGVTNAATFEPTTLSPTALKQREEAYKLYQSTLRQIDQASRDAGVSSQGNVLAGDGNGNGAQLKVNLSPDTETSMTIGFASASDAAGLGLAAAFASRFTQDSELDAAATAIDQALDAVGIRQKSLGSSQALIDTRMAFNRVLGETLDSASNDLTAADTDAETVRMNALQTTRQLAIKMIGAQTQSRQMLLSLL